MNICYILSALKGSYWNIVKGILLILSVEEENEHA
jgi:hypothetical protein